MASSERFWIITHSLYAWENVDAYDLSALQGSLIPCMCEENRQNNLFAAGGHAHSLYVWGKLTAASAHFSLTSLIPCMCG